MRLSLGAAAVLFGAVAACSGGGDKSGSDFANQYCALVTSCCPTIGLPANAGQCTQLASAEVSQSSYDSADGDTCLSGLQAEQSAGTLCADLGASIPQCQTAFSSPGGSTPPGGTCTTDTDCAKASGGSATCFTNFQFGDGGSSTTEMCIQTMPGQAGDTPCIGDQQAEGTIYEWSGTTSPPTTAYVCDPSAGTTCDQTSLTCIALQPTGTTCTTDSECITGDYCGYAGVSAQCAPRVADGSSCADDPTSCLTTSTCDSTTEACKPLLADGAECTDSSQCQSSSCGNGVCENAAAGFALGLLCGGL